MKTGLFDGITTNPTLLKRARQPCIMSNLKALAHKAETLNCRSLHIQAWGKTEEELTSCAENIGLIPTSDMQIHVKIPITTIGIQSARKIIKCGIPVTFTACYEIKQVLIAAALGAEHIAPYLGRIDDQGRNGKAEVIKMQEILYKASSNCKLLIASIRDINEIIDLASYGINVFTINENLAQNLLCCNATFTASDLFEKDAENNSILRINHQDK